MPISAVLPLSLFALSLDSFHFSYYECSIPKMSSRFPQTKRKGHARKPIQKATVIKKAYENESLSTSTVDKNILDKIQKCLDRAYHANASEAEAKAALFVSQKLMSQHNVSQADLIACDENSNKGHFGGRSVVCIEKTLGSSKRVMREAFVDKVAGAMCTFFDCKSFSTDHITRVSWSFFGIASNTVAAAMSFEMAHNSILEWACAYKGGTPTFNYRLGVADGLAAMANREKQRELNQVQRKELEFLAAKEREEASERQRQVDRLRLLPGPSTDVDSSSISDDKNMTSMNQDSNMADFDNDSDNEFDESGGLGIKADFNTNDAQIIDLCDDVDETIDRFVKRELAESSNLTEIPEFSAKSDTKIKTEPEPQSMPETSPWESGTQLVQFRATADQVADDYLKQKNIKLHHHRGKQR